MGSILVPSAPKSHQSQVTKMKVIQKKTNKQILEVINYSLFCQMEDDTPTNKLTPPAIEWCQSQGRPDITTVEDILNGPDGKIMASIQAGIDRANKNAVSNASKVQRYFFNNTI